MLKELKEELEKALNLMNPNWKKQNNTDDRLTNFIYYTNSLDKIIEISKSKNLDLNYVLHRWYNFKTSNACEKIFEFYGAVRESFMELLEKKIPLTTILISIFQVNLLI